MKRMEGYPAVVELEVRYRDLDPLGHVNNAVYLSYIELARVRYFELLGIAGGARIERLGRTSFTMAYLVAADGEPAARARTVHVMVGRAGEKVPLDEGLRRRVAGLESLPVEGLER